MFVYDAVTEKGFRRKFKSKHLLNYGQQVVTKNRVKYTIIPKKEAKCLDTRSAEIVAQDYVRDALSLVAEFRRQASLLK